MAKSKAKTTTRFPVKVVSATPNKTGRRKKKQRKGTGVGAKTKTHVPNKPNVHSQSNSEIKPVTCSKPRGNMRCILCLKDFLKKEAHDHFESMLHHRELESLLGRDCVHFCLVCQVFVLGLEQYASHITTPQHKDKMKRRKFKKVIYPDDSLSEDVLQKLKIRNKQLKKERAKEKNKLKKNLKQLNGPKSLKENAVQPKPWKKPKALAQTLNKEISPDCRLLPGLSTVQLHLAGRQLQSGKPSGDGFPREAPPCFSAPASNAAGPIGSADVGLLLCEIRKALGEIEPRKGERAACSEAEVQGEAPGAAQQSTLRKPAPKNDSYKDRHSPFCSATEVGKTPSSYTLQSQHVSTLISKPASGRQSSEHSTTRTENIALKKELPDDATLRTGCVVFESDGPTTKEQSSQGIAVPFIQHLDKTHEPNSNVDRSCYDVSELRKFKVKMETGPKPYVRKEKVKSPRKVERQDITGLSRSGIEVSNHEVLTQEGDNPLSEGFQWELAFPDGPSPAPTSLHQDVAANVLATKGKNTATVHCTGLPSIAVQDIGPAQAGGPAQTKMEAYAEGQQENVKQTKRKRILQNEESLVISSEGPDSKKQNATKDQVHVDHLLAVSLKEEELSRSLQEVDNFLVQARSALQAAYTEVQRLLLLKQQVCAEVNSLRTKRIEILQGMQGGFSATLSLGEKDRTVTTPIAMVNSPVTCEPSTHQHNSLKNNLSPLVAAGALLMPSIASPMPHSQVQHTFSRGLSVSPVILPSLLPSQSALAATVALPALASHGMQLTEGSMSTTIAVPGPNVPNLNIPRTRKKTSESEQSSDSDSEEVLECVGELRSAPTKGGVITTFAPDQGASGAESDGSLEMVELTPSSREVVAVDSDSSSDSESEDTSKDELPVRKTAFHTSVQRASSQDTVSKNKSSSSTQTSLVELKEDNTEKIIELPTVTEITEDELGSFQGHAGPIHGLQVHEGILYTCSGDKTARAYSLKNKECQAVYEGHTSKVNCLLVSSLLGLPAQLYTGSSDQTIRRYSIRTNKCLEQICLPERVLCMHASGRILYAGLANGIVFRFDLRTKKQLNIFECHVPRGVSCLGTSQEGARRLLLVGSYDSTISVRDAKSGLLLRTLQGHTKTVLCMKVVNDLVFSGSSDTSVHAHNIHTGELVRIYKGHGHAVTSLAILGKVMVTSCLDKLVRVYELQSHDRLQVYGGHNDMVMGMAINNSVIYTGCYDGSIQAVKLNLIKNYRCWWHGCSLIFGIAEHLHQHLLSLHCSPTHQTLKCRWRNCDAFFSKPGTIQLDLPGHMRHHVEADSRIET